MRVHVCMCKGVRLSTALVHMRTPTMVLAARASWCCVLGPDLWGRAVRP